MSPFPASAAGAVPHAPAVLQNATGAAALTSACTSAPSIFTFSGLSASAAGIFTVSAETLAVLIESTPSFTSASARMNCWTSSPPSIVSQNALLNRSV